MIFFVFLCIVGLVLVSSFTGSVSSKSWTSTEKKEFLLWIASQKTLFHWLSASNAIFVVVEGGICERFLWHADWKLVLDMFTWPSRAEVGPRVKVFLVISPQKVYFPG